jgi:hypothetical protein
MGVFKNADESATTFRYVSSAVTRATKQMGIFQRELVLCA